MDRRQRIINALEHRESDYIPYNLEFTYNAYLKMARHFADDSFFEKINNHLISCGTGSFIEKEKGFFYDEFGVCWNRTVDKDIGVVSNRLIEDYDHRTYKLPDINEDGLRKGLEWLKASKSDMFGIFNISFSMFERAWTLRGMEDTLIDMITNPKELHGLLEEITDYNLKAIDLALGYDFVDGIMFGDDWGSQKGLIMGRDFWVEFIKPYMKKMYQKAKSNGRYVLQHSCGDIEDIFPDLIEIGLDCYQTFQPEIYAIAKIKEEYGRDLTFWGGISTQQLLPYASAGVVKAETIKIMDIMGKGGGYIAAPTHAIPGDVPLENILAMLEVFQNQNAYLK